MGRRTAAALLALAVLAGGVLRLYHLRAVGGHYAPHVDQEEGYYETGISKLSCGVHAPVPDSRPSDFLAPIYPSFFGAVESFFARPSPYHARAAKALLSTLAVAAAGLLGWWLFSPAAGVLAAALLAFDVNDVLEVSALNIHGFYGSALLALGISLALWLEKRDARRAVLLGLMTAATLLCRVAHFPFPLLLAAACLWRWRFPEGGRRALWPVAAAAALFLAPMSLRNGLQFGSWGPFDRKGCYVLVRSSTGPYVDSTEEPARAAAESIEPGFKARRLEGREEHIALTALAVKQILRAPLPYAGYCLQRLRIFWEGLWLYLLLGAWALWRRRGDRALEALVLTAGSLSGYAIAGGTPPYRPAAVPLLCVIAGAGLASMPIFDKAAAEPAEVKRRLRAGALVLPGAFAAMYAAMLVFMAVELRDHLRPDPRAPAAGDPCPDGRALHALRLAALQAGGRGPAAKTFAGLLRSSPPEASRNPVGLIGADYWIERASALVRAGERDAAAAARGGERAAALESLDKDYRGAAASLKALLAERPRDADLLLERADVAARAGDRDAALEFLALAGRVETLTETQRRSAAAQRLRLYEFYRERGDYGRAAAVAKALTESSPGDAALWLRRAESEARSGARDAALESLARAERLSLGEPQLRRAAGIYRALKEHRRALSPLGALLRIRPRDAGLRLERAECETKAGERAAALASMAGAMALELSPGDRRRAVAAYRELGEPVRALDALRPLLDGAPDGTLWLERGELEAQAGSKAEALVSLARAEASTLDDDARRRAALSYQSLGEYARAVAILDGLIGRSPREASLHGDKGLCQYLAGDAAAAISTLKTAIALGPELIPAYLTLGAIHAARGDSARALKVYDEGLARAGGDAPLRGELAREREAILAKGAR